MDRRITLLGNRGMAAVQEPSASSLIVLLAVFGAFYLYQRRIRVSLAHALHAPSRETAREETT